MILVFEDRCTSSITSKSSLKTLEISPSGVTLIKRFRFAEAFFISGRPEFIRERLQRKMPQSDAGGLKCFIHCTY